MQSHELLREVFQKVGPKEIADELGLSLSMIYKWAQPAGDTGSGTSNPLDRIEQLLEVTKDPRIAQWVSERAGGFHIENPEKHWPHPYFLIPATNHVVQEFADLLSVVATSARDNRITPDEAARIRKRWEQLKSATEGFVHCCEQGNFGPLREELKEAEGSNAAA